MLRSCLYICILMILAGTTVSGTTVYTAAVCPRTGALSFFDEQDLFFSVSDYAWGPEWSPVHRDRQVEEADGQARWRIASRVQATDTTYTINATWSQPETHVLRFEATLKPDADTELVQVVFPFEPGNRLRGGEARITHADQTHETVPIPLERATWGDRIESIVFTGPDGTSLRVHFDEPAHISVDRGGARLAIARARLTHDKPNTLAFSVTADDPIAFYPGPDSVPPSQEGWFEIVSEQGVPPESEYNLTDWIDAPAGRHGRIRARGGQLWRGGEPIQLWGLNNTYAACAPERETAHRRADFYAAMGINTIRLHKYADGTGWAGILAEHSALAFDPEMLDRMDYFVSVLKERGLYIKLSPVFIMPIGPEDAEHIPYLEDFDLNPRTGWRNPGHGSLYFSRELQDMLIAQFRTLLTHRNPYTGLTYAEDPAIAFVELYNEDSIFFGGTSRALASSATLRERAGRLFARWLQAKYETEEAFLEAWGGARALNTNMLRRQRIPTDESWAEERIYPIGNQWFYDPANLDTSQAAYRRRLLDTMRFLYEYQNYVYDRIAHAIRETGYDGELVASNWIAGRQMSHFYNLHSDARIGTIDRHNYFGGGRGPYHANASMLATPGSGILSSSMHQVADRPFMLSEWIHVIPNEWGAEGAALIAAYGMGLQGWDVSYAFQNADEGGFSRVLQHPWDVTAPQFIGLFPAVSRQIHRRDVAPARYTHFRNVHMPSLDDGRVGFSTEEEAAGDIKTYTSDVFPAEALAVSRGLVRFTEHFEETDFFDVEPFRQDGELVSDTGELRWKPGRHLRDGYFSIHTPATQALVGFAEGVTRELGDVTLTSLSHFGAFYFSAQSREGTLANDAILVSAISRARNRGAIIAGERFIMQQAERERWNWVGPVVMEPIQARVQVHRPGAVVHALDQQGVRTGARIPVSDDGKFLIDTGRDESPYYLITFE